MSRCSSSIKADGMMGGLVFWEGVCCHGLGCFQVVFGQGMSLDLNLGHERG